MMTFWEGFHSFGVKLLKIVYLNFLWLFFSLIGFFLFGLFPATIALFTVVRQILLEVEQPITQTFWQTYKKEWLRGNGYAAITYVVLLILAVDFYMIYSFDPLSILLIPTLIITFLIIGTLFFLFPVYVHFELSFFAMIKQAFLFTLTAPSTVLLNTVVVLIMYGLFNLIPGAIPLFVGSMLSYFVMLFSIRAFKKIEQKKLTKTVST